jgi:hypothetical protein
LHSRKDSAAPDRQLLRKERHPNPERSSLPKPEGHTAGILEPNRLGVILQRLQQAFYDQAPASDRIAAAVLVDLKDFDESSPALPH